MGSVVKVLISCGGEGGRGAGGRKRRPLALSPGVYVLARARRVLSGPWVAEAPHLLRGAALGPGALASCRASCRARQAWLAPVEEGHCARAPGGKGSSFCGVSFWDWGALPPQVSRRLGLTGSQGARQHLRVSFPGCCPQGSHMVLGTAQQLPGRFSPHLTDAAASEFLQRTGRSQH